MISDLVRNFLEAQSYVYLATTDASGQPHIAIVENAVISGDSLLVIEDCFCPVTLQNIAGNTRISFVMADLVSGTGYQMIGTVNRYASPAALAYSDTVQRMPVKQRVLTRFTVTIDTILEFTSGIHSDLPIDLHDTAESR